MQIIANELDQFHIFLSLIQQTERGVHYYLIYIIRLLSFIDLSIILKICCTILYIICKSILDKIKKT